MMLNMNLAGTIAFKEALLKACKDKLTKTEVQKTETKITKLKELFKELKGVSYEQYIGREDKS